MGDSLAADLMGKVIERILGHFREQCSQSVLPFSSQHCFVDAINRAEPRLMLSIDFLDMHRVLGSPL